MPSKKQFAALCTCGHSRADHRYGSECQYVYQRHKGSRDLTTCACERFEQKKPASKQKHATKARFSKHAERYKHMELQRIADALALTFNADVHTLDDPDIPVLQQLVALKPDRRAGGARMVITLSWEDV